MKRRFILTLLLLIGINFSSASIYHISNESEVVRVSWYGKKFHGKLTASGEVYDMYDFTAAHKTLPFGTKVKITNVRNSKSVIVTVNDRGPFVKNRKFDLSKAAFAEIADNDRGVINAKYEVL